MKEEEAIVAINNDRLEEKYECNVCENEVNVTTSVNLRVSCQTIRRKSWQNY